MRRELGHGIGLRTAHYRALTEAVKSARPTGLDWLEAISENYLAPGGAPRATLRSLREHFPIALHGVSLSIGSTDPLDPRYLAELAELTHELEPALVTDHLCWTSVGGHHTHDLLPLPFTDEALAHVAERVERVQERLGRPIALENVSSYLRYRHATMSEWEFLAALTRRTSCLVLLDLNNVFVSAHNHGFDPETYVRALPSDAVAQYHLAGHTRHDALLLDTHDGPVCDEVWSLYAEAVRLHGARPTIVEWDEQVPELADVVAESARAAHVAARASARPSRVAGADG